MYVYVPHYHRNYESTPKKDANIHEKIVGEPDSMATPHEHSKYIEKKLKSEGHFVHRTSDIHLNVDKDVNIESHSVGSYISGNNKSQLHNIYKNITKVPSNKPKSINKLFNNINTKESELIYENVQNNTYYINRQLDESIRYFRVKAPSYQIAEDVIDILLNK